VYKNEAYILNNLFCFLSLNSTTGYWFILLD